MTCLWTGNFCSIWLYICKALSEFWIVCVCTFCFGVCSFAKILWHVFCRTDVSINFEILLNLSAAYSVHWSNHFVYGIIWVTINLIKQLTKHNSVSNPVGGRSVFVAVRHRLLSLEEVRQQLSVQSQFFNETSERVANMINAKMSKGWHLFQRHHTGCCLKTTNQLNSIFRSYKLNK